MIEAFIWPIKTQYDITEYVQCGTFEQKGWAGESLSL